MEIQEVRKKFPQYNDMSDAELGRALHKKFYSDIPYDEFEKKIGLSAAPRQRGLVEELGRQIGLTARAGITGALAPATMVGDALGLGSSRAVGGLMDKFLPTPQGGIERVSQDVAGAMAGAGGLARVASLASPTGAIGQGVAQALSAAPATQLAASGAASGAAGTTREMGGGPTAQLAAGLAAGVGVPMAYQAGANLPRNWMARSIQKSEARPFAAEGQRLADSTGMDLTIGQRTGSKSMLGMENAARQFGSTADRIQDMDLKVANQAIARITTIADRISTGKVDPATIGTRIEATVKGAANRLDELRDAAATRDYGAVRRIAGDQPVIRFDNFRATLQKIVDDFQNVAGDDAQKVASQARAALEKTGKSRLIVGDSEYAITEAKTVSEAMRTRSFYGKAAAGKANVFENIAPDLQRTLSSRLFGAINKDFDDSAANAGGALKDALGKANTNYKKFSQSIEYLEKSTLGRLVGDDVADAALSGATRSTTAGEAVINKLMATHPSSRKTAMDIMERWNPDLAKQTRAFFLRNALDEGMSVPPSARGASEVPLSFNRFVKALGGDKTSFQDNLKSYGFKEAEINDIVDLSRAMMRAGDRTGFNFSNTNVQSENVQIGAAIGQAALVNPSWAAQKIITLAGKHIGMNKIADAMTSAEGRAAIRTIVSPKASPQAVISAFATVEGKE